MSTQGECQALLLELDWASELGGLELGGLESHWPLTRSSQSTSKAQLASSKGFSQ